MHSTTTLARFAWLSIAAALVTISLKGTAYFLTGSVGLLSDALESVVNLVAAGGALIALLVAARPVDEDHLDRVEDRESAERERAWPTGEGIDGPSRGAESGRREPELA